MWQHMRQREKRPTVRWCRLLPTLNSSDRCGCTVSVCLSSVCLSVRISIKIGTDGVRRWQEVAVLRMREGNVRGRLEAGHRALAHALNLNHEVRVCCVFLSVVAFCWCSLQQHEIL